MAPKSHQTRLTVHDIQKHKGEKPLVCLTAYDAMMAGLADPYCDVLLVGDSVGMVVHGMPSTLGVTVDMMILHTKAVMRGSDRAFVVVDLPFGSYEKGAKQAFETASRIMGETGCQAVKLETGAYASPIVEFLTERGIPVMGHVGLRPQSVHTMGGFKVQGRYDKERHALMQTARAVEGAGAFSLVIEGVYEALAASVTKAVSIPTIGIGASSACDGQILVLPDMLGFFDHTPRFVRRYAQGKAMIETALEAYTKDVRERRFPGEGEIYDDPEDP